MLEMSLKWQARYCLSLLSLIFVAVLASVSVNAAERLRLYEAERVYPVGPLSMENEFDSFDLHPQFPREGIDVALYQVKGTQFFFTCNRHSREVSIKALLDEKQNWSLLSEDEQSSVACAKFASLSQRQYGANDTGSPEFVYRANAYVGVPADKLTPFDMKPFFWAANPNTERNPLRGHMLVVQNRLLVTTERPPKIQPKTADAFLVVVECPNVVYQSNGSSGARYNWARVYAGESDPQDTKVEFMDAANRIIGSDQCRLFYVLKPVDRPADYLPKTYW